MLINTEDVLQLLDNGPPQGRNRLREMTVLYVVLTLFISRVSETS